MSEYQKPYSEHARREHERIFTAPAPQRLVLETKADYVAAHRKLWNKIIEMRKNGDMSDIEVLKEHAMKELFGDVYRVNNYCFGCRWASREMHSDCGKCLFDINTQFSCLNGLFGRLQEAKDDTKFIDLATQIRDFPVREGE